MKPFVDLQSIINEKGGVKVEQNFMSQKLISRVVDDYSDTIYKIAYNITGNADDSYDVCQEVFFRLIKNKEKIKNEEHLKAWLIRTTINCGKSTATEAYKRHTIPLSSVAENMASIKDNYDDIIELVLKLPEKYKTVIHLHYYEELTIETIAETLGVSKNTVKTRLARGRKLLKKYIEKEV